LGEIGENRAFEFQYLSNSVLETSKVNVTYLGLLGSFVTPLESMQIDANRPPSWIGCDKSKTRSFYPTRGRTDVYSFRIYLFRIL